MLFKDMSDKKEIEKKQDEHNEDLTVVQQIVENTEEVNIEEELKSNDLMVSGKLGNDITQILKEVFEKPDVEVNHDQIVLTSESIKDKTYIYSGKDNNLLSNILKAKDSGQYSKVAVYLSKEDINNDVIIKFLSKENIDVLITENALKQYISDIKG